jgi:hypothetical protein
MRRLAVLFSALVAIGCGGDTQSLTLPVTDANVAGNYLLTASNGRTLPIIAFVTADEEYDLTSDQFVIGADNTWGETTNYTVTSFSTGATRTTSSQSIGTYAIASGHINFTITDGNIAFTGSVTSNKLTVLFNGGQFVYQR